MDISGSFQLKTNLLAQKDKVGFHGGAFEQKIFFLNVPKGSRRAQKSFKWSKTTMLTISDPFGPLWNVDKPAKFFHFVCFIGAFFGDTLYNAHSIRLATILLLVKLHQCHTYRVF